MVNLEKFANKRYLVLRYLADKEGLFITYNDISSAVRMNRHYVLDLMSELKRENYIQQTAKCTYALTPLGKKVIKTIEKEI